VVNLVQAPIDLAPIEDVLVLLTSSMSKSDAEHGLRDTPPIHPNGDVLRALHGHLLSALLPARAFDSSKGARRPEECFIPVKDCYESQVPALESRIPTGPYTLQQRSARRQVLGTKWERISTSGCAPYYRQLSCQISPSYALTGPSPAFRGELLQVQL
jgi:hypothetical protein